MKPRVCICCGEPIPERRSDLPRNPNMCASCSNLADGLEELDAPESAHSEEGRPLASKGAGDMREAA
jgi:RNA polymerase-binding transcription factor DksA